MLKVVTIFLGLVFSAGLVASEWYDGGTLSGENALAWQKATLGNKVASSGDFMAVMYQSGYLKSEISSSVKGVNDLAPYSILLAECIDQATSKHSNAEENQRVFSNQKVSEIGASCASLMGWLE